MSAEEEFPRVPDARESIEKARKENGLSFGYAGEKISSKLGTLNLPEVGYYITWFERKIVDDRKISIRYVFFPYDKILIVHRIMRYSLGGSVRDEEKLEVLPAYGTWMPSSMKSSNVC
jgi:hypothetical protein